MKKHELRKLMILFTGLVIGHFLVGQTHQTTENIIDKYFKSAGGLSVLYSGKEQIKYPRSNLNHPYYKTDEYQDASLSFDGVLYPNVKVRLDLYKNEVILFSPDFYLNTVVANDRLDFVCIGTDYITQNVPEGDGAGLSHGFHIRLYNGAHPVWLKQSCMLVKKSGEKTAFGLFEFSKKFYVYKDGKYCKVKGKKSMLKLFPSHKKELNQFIKSSQLNFKQFPENAIVEVVKEYERIHIL